MNLEPYENYFISDVNKKAEQNLFTVISTFSGGGGSSIGYKLAGGDVLCVNEFVEEAVRTYKSNFPDTPVLIDDIKKLTGQDFLDISGLSVGELDILDGSPPCSAFSMSGSRDRGWGKTKKYSDNKNQENIEDLFLEFIRICNDIKPKVIIAENVAGLDMGKSKEKLSLFRNSFRKIGYLCTTKIISSVDFNTAQNRKRLMFICVRSDIAEDAGFNMLTIQNIFPTSKKNIVTIFSAIENITQDADEISEQKMLLDFVDNSFQKKFIEPLKFNPERILKPSDPENIDWNPKGSCFNMIRSSPKLPSPTLTAMGQQRAVSGVFHYNYNRKFTINELKRIMGLPDDYVLTGTFDQKAERVCRMVAPKMMCAIVESVYKKVLMV